MQTDHVTLDIDRELLQRRRPWYILAGIVLVLSLILRQPLLFLIALFTLVIAVVPDIWYRRALRRLVVYQRVNQHRLFFGEEVTLSIVIENQKFLPLPWLRVENTITPPLLFGKQRVVRLQPILQDTHISTWLLWPFQRVTRNYRMYCQSRGLHILGPMRLSCSDPLGWLEIEVRLPASETLLVYPLIAPLETLGLPSVHPFGEHTTTRNFLEDPLRVAGVRDYVLGDDPRRIHWKATAHMGSLRSKIYEPSSLRRLLVLLDVWNYSARLKEADPDIQEFTITAAASLAVWGLAENYMVALLTNGSIITSSQDSVLPEDGHISATQEQQEVTTVISPPGVSVPFALDPQQQERLLAVLARLVPGSNTTMERLLDISDSMLLPGTTIVLVSAASSLSDGVVERLDDIRKRGASVHLALTGWQEGQALPETYSLPVYHLGGKETWHEIVRTVGDAQAGNAGISATPLQLD